MHRDPDFRAPTVAPVCLARASSIITAGALVLLAAGGGARADQGSGAGATPQLTTPESEIERLVLPGEAPVRLRVRSAAASQRTGAVAIDGRLDEEAWRSAGAEAGFWQREPHEGGSSRFSTEFRVLFDDRAIYVAVRAFDPEPSLIRGLMTRRDVDSSSDWISVMIDSYRDRRTAFGFSVNAAGVQRDVFHFNDLDRDAGWDAVWESGVAIDGQGWTAEFRIPYNQLRFPDVSEQIWGLQVLRRVQRTQELSVWSPWPRNASQEVSLYGTVDGIRGVQPARRIELLPYAVGGARLYSPSSADPLLDGRDSVTQLGLDVKYGMGPSFTLSGTINPDFGQVEADPSQVNLTAEEIFFQEKRPFFVEGTDIFRYSLGTGAGTSVVTSRGSGDTDESIESIFYTRRIGAPPHANPLDRGAYASAPDFTSIYGAVKLSGKTANGWSVGLLDAVTGQEDALVAPEGGSAEDAERVILEPLTNYGVARVRKDLREGRTTIGVAVTAVNRSLEGTKLELHDQAYTGGLEAVHRFWNENWTADLRLAGSYVHGSPEAIDRTQRSSVHYLQRPDADHLDYDPTRTSLSGGAMLWSFGKSAGGHWRVQTGGDGRTPGFETNDIGFQIDSGYYLHWFSTQYREDKPGVLKNYTVKLNLWRMWDTSSRHLTTAANLTGNFDLPNYWGAGGGFGVGHRVWDRGGLRGGPLLHRDMYYPVWFNAWSDPRRPVTANVISSGWMIPASGSWGADVTPLISIQARSNLELAAGPTFGVNNDDSQFVTTAADQAGQPRYVLGRIHQVTAALTLRASYTFSPRMGIQFYAQPFISSGRYREYKEAVMPGAESYDDRYHVFEPGEVREADGLLQVDRNGDGASDFSFAPADFNFRELRSNLVFRWEYLPGSAFFLIWSHGRTSTGPDGRFALGSDLSDLADETGEHVILAKLNYWLGL